MKLVSLRGAPLPGWIIVVLLLGAWQIWASTVFMPSLPPLDRIAADWAKNIWGGNLFWAMIDTLRIMFIGFGAAVLIGITLGFLMGRLRVVWSCLEPIVELLRQTPVSALLPLLILYLGLGDTMKTVIVILAATFPILMNAYAGARSVSQTTRETAETFQLSWWELQIEVALPAAAPFIVVGMRQGLGLALILSVVTGMLAGNSGIGYFILEAQQTLNITSLFAGIFTVAVTGYALNWTFLLIEHRLLRWRRIDARTN